MAVVLEASNVSSTASCAEVQPAGTTSENSTSTAVCGREQGHGTGCQGACKLAGSYAGGVLAGRGNIGCGWGRQGTRSAGQGLSCRTIRMNLIKAVAHVTESAPALTEQESGFEAVDGGGVSARPQPPQDGVSTDHR